MTFQPTPDNNHAGKNNACSHTNESGVLKFDIKIRYLLLLLTDRFKEFG